MSKKSKMTKTSAVSLPLVLTIQGDYVHEWRNVSTAKLNGHFLDLALAALCKLKYVHLRYTGDPRVAEVLGNDIDDKSTAKLWSPTSDNLLARNVLTKFGIIELDNDEDVVMYLRAIVQNLVGDTISVPFLILNQ